MSKFGIQRFKTTLTIVIATDADEIVSEAFPLNGKLKGIIPTAPDLDSTDTYTITIKDADGNTIYTKATLAESVASPQFVDANNHPLQLPLAGNHTITIKTSSDQDANRIFTVVLLIER